MVTEQPWEGSSCWEGGGCPGKVETPRALFGVGFLRLWTCGETPVEISILAPGEHHLGSGSPGP